jgi:hypothetical protein
MMALFSVALWSWTQFEGWQRNVLLVGLPMLFALIWGIFAVPNDPSRSGKTVVKTPGLIRLLIELGLFLASALAFYFSGYHIVAYVFLGIVLIHYVISLDRIKWLLSQD